MSHNGSGLGRASPAGSDNLPGKPVDVDSGDGLSASKENQAPDLHKINPSPPGSSVSRRTLHSSPDKNRDENDNNSNRHHHHHHPHHHHHHQHQHTVRPRSSRDTSRGGLNDGTQRPARTGSGGTEPEPHGIFRQLETHIIPEDQLVNEVRGIYAGLVMVEKKCIEIDKQQSESPHELSHLQWQALIALHRTLLHEHHDFFLASQHPSASPVLKRLSEKYAMPARMWRYGIHSFLELLRHRLPGSLEHTLTFLYLAYSMMTLLLESVPAFEDTWIECLGDLARYRMAVEESDMRDREAWAGVARYWYHQAADKNPSVGRIQHHLAVLARPDMFQQLFYYTKSLVSLHSFPSAGESILLLFQPLLNSPKPYNQPVVASAFVTAHGVLFTHGSIDKFKTLVQEYLSHLDMYIGRLGAAFRLHGAYMASSNFAAVFQYGFPDAVLPSEFKQDTAAQQPQSYSSASENWTPGNNLDKIEADFVALQDSQSTQLIYYAVHLAFQTFSVILDQVGNKNVHPAVHTYLAFIWCMALNHASIRLIEVVVPWSKLTTFLNTMIHSSTDFPRMEGDELPIPEDRKQLPEDFLIRGQIWSQRYFPADFFEKSLPDDDGRSIEVPSLALSRMYRCLWLGVRISMVRPPFR